MQNQFHFGAQSQILVNPPHQVPNLIGGQVPPNPMGQIPLNLYGHVPNNHNR